MHTRFWRSLLWLGLSMIVVLGLHSPVFSQNHLAPSLNIHFPSFLIFSILGLVGSGHCVGMCGPFVLAYTRQPNNHWIDHVLYGLGRATTYALMGLSVSLLGQFLQSLMGFRAVLLILAGSLMLYLALAQLNLVNSRLPSIQSWRWYQRSVQFLFARQHPFRTYPLGFVLGFIPCGLTAIALSLALTQSTVSATLGMFLFGLGTMPAMVGFGLLIQRLKFPKLQRYIAMVMVLLGGLTIWLGTYRLGLTPAPPQLALLHQLHPTSLAQPAGMDHHTPIPSTEHPAQDSQHHH